MGHRNDRVAGVGGVDTLDNAVSSAGDGCIALDDGGELVLCSLAISVCSAHIVGFTGDGNTNDVVSFFDGVRFGRDVVGASKALGALGCEVFLTLKVLAEVPCKSTLRVGARGFVDVVKLKQSEVTGDNVASQIRSHG